MEVAQARWQDAAPGGTRLSSRLDKSQAMCHSRFVNSPAPSSLRLLRAVSNRACARGVSRTRRPAFRMPRVRDAHGRVASNRVRSRHRDARANRRDVLTRLGGLSTLIRARSSEPPRFGSGSAHPQGSALPGFPASPSRGIVVPHGARFLTEESFPAIDRKPTQNPTGRQELPLPRPPAVTHIHATSPGQREARRP